MEAMALFSFRFPWLAANGRGSRPSVDRNVKKPRGRRGSHGATGKEGGGRRGKNPGQLGTSWSFIHWLCNVVWNWFAWRIRPTRHGSRKETGMESTGILLGLASSRSKPRNETHSPCERFARLHRRFGDEGDRHPSFQSPRLLVSWCWTYREACGELERVARRWCKLANGKVTFVRMSKIQIDPQWMVGPQEAQFCSVPVPVYLVVPNVLRPGWCGASTNRMDWLNLIYAKIVQANRIEQKFQKRRLRF